MKRRTQVILGGIFFALLFVYAGVSAYHFLSFSLPESDPGWQLNLAGGRFVMRSVNADGPAAVLRPGDVVRAINGQPISNLAQLRDIIQSLVNQEPGTPYTITVQRGNQLLEFALRTGEATWGVQILWPFVIVLIEAIFIITGLAVFLLKPFDKQAVLLALMFGMFIGAIMATARWTSLANGMATAEPVTWFSYISVAVHLVSLFWWPVFFHFFLIFPEPSPLLQKFPRLEKYLYVPHLLVIFPYLAIVNVLSFFAPEQGVRFAREFSALGMLALIPCVLYIGGGLLSLLVNYRQASRASRRKMRVVVAGSIAGFLPVSLLMGLAFVFGLSGPTVRWLGPISILAFPLFPLSFAYAIVRHRVIPVRLILRRGVRYLLVSRGFIIIQAVVVFAVLSYLLSGSRLATIDAFGPRADIVVTVVATAIAIGVLTFVNQRVMPVIDRRFFRESYDPQQVLAELGERIRTATSARQLLALVASNIQDTLHAENITVFWRDAAAGDYTGAVSSRLTANREVTQSSAGDLALPGDGVVAARLRQSPRPLVVEYRDPKSLSLLPDAFPAGLGAAHQQERAVLNRIHSTLLVPVAFKDQLLGVISLGPRLGDLPYSREDRQLLMAIAWQTAFAVQNLMLVQQIAEEERLRH
ncbi:MAG TPA: GAF domain-containing protein, partial [Blastocatellia bacterium]|nr:GAF domain-containing protein [Blastocatellia bacterium]